MLDQADAEYRCYLEERKSLAQAEFAVAQKLDSSLLTLSAGAFGLSITFLRYIAPTPHPTTIGWAIGAWILFLAAIAFTVIALRTSQEAYGRARDILDEDYETNEEVDETNLYERATFWLSLLALVAFIGGAISLAVFARLNLN